MKSYSKKRRTTAAFKNVAESFLKDRDQLFDIFCKDAAKRRKLERKYEVRMQQLDYQLYENQKGPRVGKCLDTVEKFE